MREYNATSQLRVPFASKDDLQPPPSSSSSDKTIFCEFWESESTDEVVVLIDGICNDGFQFEPFIRRVIARTSTSVVRFDY